MANDKEPIESKDKRSETIGFSDFLKLDVRTRTIAKVEDFPEAIKAAYKLEIGFGPLGKKRSSAQIT